MKTVKVVTSAERARRVVEDPAKYFAEVRAEVRADMLQRYPTVSPPLKRPGLFARIRRWRAGTSVTD